MRIPIRTHSDPMGFVLDTPQLHSTTRKKQDNTCRKHCFCVVLYLLTTSFVVPSTLKALSTYTAVLHLLLHVLVPHCTSLLYNLLKNCIKLWSAQVLEARLGTTIMQAVETVP